MAGRSRLKTKSRKKRWPLILILLLLTISAGSLFQFRRELPGFVKVWRETFVAKEENNDGGQRGVIFDRNFKELARTLERVSLYVRPREVVGKDQTAATLAKILGMPKEELLAAFERDSHLVWLRRDISQEDEELVAELNLPGLYFHREYGRSYPEQEKASHLIGFSENNHGLSGVEHYYNRLLNQDRVRQDDLPFIDLQGMTQTSAGGHDLVLTLDMKIQTVLEDFVADLGHKMGEGRIVSLLLDTAGGKIIGGANYPAYNPNIVWQHEENVLESLFFTQMVIPDEIRTFFREASLLQGGWEEDQTVYPWSIVSPVMDFARQIRLWDRLRLSTDIQVDFSGGKKRKVVLPEMACCIPEEDCGAVPRTATPMKVLLGMAHLLNGGKKIQPHILDRIVERSSRNEYHYDAFLGSSEGRHVLPSMVSAELRQLLRSVGKKAVLETRILSGETVSLSHDYSGGSYVRDRMALLVVSGFEPELMLLIASRENSLGPDSGKRLDSSFLTEKIDDILPSMVALQQVNINLADMLEQPEPGKENYKKLSTEKAKKTESGSLVEILEQHTMVMPDVTGLSLRKALRMLQRSNVEISAAGSGRIVRQVPGSGEVLEKGGAVKLFLEIDTGTDKVEMIEQ